MWKRLTTAIAAAALLLTTAVSAADLTTSEAAKLLTDTTYWFGTTGSKGGFCTASKIGPSQYITARHCAEGLSNDFRLISPKGNYVFIRSVLVSTSDKQDGKRWEDWAILNSSRASDAPSLFLACSEPVTVGMGVAALGYPEGLSKAFVTGYVSTMEKGRARNQASFFADLPLAPGASGAPLISMTNGHLIGVVTEGVFNTRTTEFYMAGIESIESTDICEDWARRMKHYDEMGENDSFIPVEPTQKGEIRGPKYPEEHT